MERFASIVTRNSSAGAAAQLLIKLLSFGFAVLIVRQLGAEEFGQYAAIGAFASLFLFIGDLGLSPYAVRQVARLRDQPDGPTQINRLFNDIVSLRLILTTFGCCVMLVSAWLSGRPWVMIGAMALTAIGMITYAVEGTSEAFLAGYERLDITAGAKVIYQIIFVTLGSLVLLQGLGYYGLIYATLISIAALTFTCWLGVRRIGIQLTWPRASLWGPMLRASLPFGVITFALGLSYKFDSVLLNIYRSDAETGYYNAAYNLVFSMVTISTVINTSLYPSLTRQAIAAPQTLPVIYERMLRYLLIISLPIAVGGSLLAEPLVDFLFGPAYAPAAPALQIVLWTVPLMFLSEFLSYVVVVAGEEKRVARAIIMSTSFNVALNLALLPRYGIVAAAATTVLTEALLVLQCLWFLRDTLRPIRWGSMLVRVGGASILMGTMVAAAPWLPLLARIAAGALIYAALLLSLRVIGAEEWRFLRRLQRRPASVEGGSA